MESDAIYFDRRASEEKVAALKAGNANARHSHLTMAKRYEELARALEAHQPELSVRFSR
jgi:hypothetical protein